ncbi:MAG: hypothetical protein SFV51_15580 [Bryobacteraceae bacterium]|nr:hypothetical protein [Bryobacteraceae bacterium]
MKISVVRGQRLYHNHQWPHPVVVKLENVEPAITRPPYAETGAASAAADVGFEYQEYGGFAAAMHNTGWKATGTRRMTAKGAFEMRVTGLKPEVEYQCRAFVKHPWIIMRGDHKLFTTGRTREVE